MKRELLLLGAILIFFLTTRFYKVSSVPNSLYWDEASIGYNAYSISQTGKDEWGKSMPFYFKAFGEYKLPLYVYSTVIPVKLFGLNEFSVRIPSIIFSFFNIVLVYLIAKKISESSMIGLLSAFFMSITPYMFIFSRTGYEAVAGLTFYLLGVLFYLFSFKRVILFVFSSLFFVVSMYAYNGYVILTPITILILSVIFAYSNRKKLFKIVFILFLSTLMFIALCYPMAKFYLSSNDSISRYQAIGIENLTRSKVFIGLDILRNYLSHFNPNYLFLNGDTNPRSAMPGFGEFYIYDAAMLILGLITIFKKKGREIFLLIFVLLGFIPASLTRETPHALRSLSTVPFFVIIFSYGVVSLLERFSEYKNLILKFLVFVYLGVFLVYFNNFINVYSSVSSKDWQQGYKLIYLNYAKDFKSFDHILISDRYSQPYIFALAYQSFNPDRFRESAILNTDLKKATSVIRSFDKFIFTSIDFNQLPYGRSLIFSHPTDRLNELPLKDTLYHSDGSVAFYVYENKR